MVRTARRISSTGTYHVMMRGNEKKDIFLDEYDKSKFLFFLDRKQQQEEYDLIAYCVMNNHVHLLIQEQKLSLSKVMSSINTSYALYFNKKYKRVGHVFQDRFLSEAIELEDYLLAAVRYIHNNPVKAGTVLHPESYRWSSFSSYLSDRKDQVRVNKDFILDLLSPVKTKARQMFLEHSGQDGCIEFMDVTNEAKPEVKDEKMEYINKFLTGRNLILESIRQRKNSLVRQELINKLRETGGISDRGIAQLLNISKTMVQRTK